MAFSYLRINRGKPCDAMKKESIGIVEDLLASINSHRRKIDITKDTSLDCIIGMLCYYLCFPKRRGKPRFFLYPLRAISIVRR